MFFEIVAIVEPDEIAVTAPAPAEVIGSIKLPDAVMDPFDVPRSKAVIAPPPVTFVIVLVFTTEPAAPKFTLRTVITPVGVALAVILLNVLLVIVLTGAPPSVLDQPAIIVLPGTVTFEKLLRLFVIAEPATEEAFAAKNVTVPPAPPLLNAVTIELLLTFSTPVAVMLDARARNVTEAVVLTFRLVNVLLLILSVTDEAWLQLMYVFAFAAAAA